MRKPVEIENIAAVRYSEGIDDVELREEKRASKMVATAAYTSARRSALDVFPIGPMGIREAIQKALGEDKAVPNPSSLGTRP